MRPDTLAGSGRDVRAPQGVASSMPRTEVPA